MRNFAMLSCLLMAAVSLSAQAPVAEFEVASVKPAVPLRSFADFVRRPPPGDWRAIGLTLQDAIALAHPQFALPGLVVGGPEWVRETRFDLEARMDPATPGAQVPAMVRRLLEQRFSLRTHVERRTLDVFVMTLAQPGKPGPGMKPALPLCVNAREERLPFPEECTISVPRDWTRVLAAPAQTPTEALLGPHSPVDRPVVDRTGLEGYFRMTVLGAPNEAVSVFTAIQEQLGLKLTPARETVDVLVIDSAKIPEPD